MGSCFRNVFKRNKDSYTINSDEYAVSNANDRFSVHSNNARFSSYSNSSAGDETGNGHILLEKKHSDQSNRAEKLKRIQDGLDDQNQNKKAAAPMEETVKKVERTETVTTTVVTKTGFGQAGMEERQECESIDEQVEKIREEKEWREREEEERAREEEEREREEQERKKEEERKREEEERDREEQERKKDEERRREEEREREEQERKIVEEEREREEEGAEELRNAARRVSSSSNHSSEAEWQNPSEWMRRDSDPIENSITLHEEEDSNVDVSVHPQCELKDSDSGTWDVELNKDSGTIVQVAKATNITTVTKTVNTEDVESDHETRDTDDNNVIERIESGVSVVKISNPRDNYFAESGSEEEDSDHEHHTAGTTVVQVTTTKTVTTVMKDDSDNEEGDNRHNEESEFQASVLMVSDEELHVQNNGVEQPADRDGDDGNTYDSTALVY